MKAFAELFEELDQTTKTNAKVEALVKYLGVAEEPDKTWAIALLSDRRPRRTVSSTLLKRWAAEKSNLPLWLFDESYHVVGDLAETIARVLPPATRRQDHSLRYWINFIRSLEMQDDESKREKIQDAWDQLDDTERFVFNKLITGAFRMGVSQQLMVKALAKFTGHPENILAHRLMGSWSPDLIAFQDLVQAKDAHDDISKPYPFYLAYAWEGDVAGLGDPDAWIAEWKWDGIRGQAIVRKNALFIWSRGEELVTDRYPEYRVMIDLLPPGTVLDGEILPYKNGKPLSFQHLQTRIGRKKLTSKLLHDVPVAFVTYDLLEFEGEDWRQRSMAERRQQLESLFSTFQSDVLMLSEKVPFDSWNALEKARTFSRERLSEGIMLKRKASPYREGRKRGDWWKWKVEPYTVDAVLIYAMRGHGRRANLYTDFTLAVWKDDELVPFTKAYSGLSDDELRTVDRWIKQHTIDRFGPVRSVKPELVFEIAFEGINRSSRHKSGVALRFPRIKQWRHDKPAAEADTLETLLTLIEKTRGQETFHEK